jgi:predicted Zn-dependent peptidase
MMAASQLREGTTTRTASQIATQLEKLAAVVNVETSFTSQLATLDASSLTEHFDEVLSLAADIPLRPTFPEEELRRHVASPGRRCSSNRRVLEILANHAMARVRTVRIPPGG